jgi:hypothetical protein
MLLASLWARKMAGKIMAIREDTSMYKSKSNGAGEGTEKEQRGGLGQLVFGGSSCSTRDTRRALTCGLTAREAAQWSD